MTREKRKQHSAVKAARPRVVVRWCGRTEWDAVLSHHGPDWNLRCEHDPKPIYDCEGDEEQDDD